MAEDREDMKTRLENYYESISLYIGIGILVDRTQIAALCIGGNGADLLN